MKVCTYARVSKKLAPDERGTSLDDQETRFREFIQATGHDRVDYSAEEVSGGKNTRTPRFAAMLERMPALGVQALVVDSLDRFTRDAFDGPAVVVKLREIGVALWELEHSWERPFDLNNEADRNYVLDKFRAAEMERARITKRQQKRYAEQRRRGATTTNRPAFGLRLVGERKGHRSIEIDPETAPIVQRVDRMVLEGASQAKVLAFVASFPKAWGSREGLVTALRNEAYVTAGVRSAETQARLKELCSKHLARQAFGPERHSQTVREHEFAGLIACGQCVAAGSDPRDCRMFGRYINSNPNPYNLVCKGTRGGKYIHEPTMISTHRLVPLLMDKLNKLRDRRVAEAVLAAWQAEPLHDRHARVRHAFDSQIAGCDEEEGAIESRVAMAFRLMESGKVGVIAEAERVLERASADRLALRAKRAAVLQQLADLPAPVRRTIHVGSLLAEAENLFLTTRWREALKVWIDTIGPPVWHGRKPRKQGRRRDSIVDLRWPFIDAVRPEAAPDFIYEPAIEKQEEQILQLSMTRSSNAACKA